MALLASWKKRWQDFQTTKFWRWRLRWIEYRHKIVEIIKDLIALWLLGMLYFTIACPPAYYLSQMCIPIIMKLALVLDYIHTECNYTKPSWSRICQIWHFPKSDQELAQFLNGCFMDFKQEEFNKEPFIEQIFLWLVDGTLKVTAKENWGAVLSHMNPVPARFIASRLRSDRRYRSCVAEYLTPN